MTSGLIVLTICVSGCVYAFEVEIRDWLQTYRHVEARDAPMLPPSELLSIAQRQLPGETASRVIYEGPNRAAYVQFGNKKTRYYKLVFLDPYDGVVLKTIDMNYEFFHIVFNIHYRLFLPPDIGTEIVDYTTLVFVVILASGLVNWWPRSWGGIGKRLAIQWRARWRRRNFDLHGVFGFYVWPLVLIIALTGLVWGFEWFNDTVYWIASGGMHRPPVVSPVSNKATASYRPLQQSIDEAWNRLVNRHPNAEFMMILLPSTVNGSIRCIVNPDRRTYYKTDHYYIDQYSLVEMPVAHSWGMYRDANTAAMVRRMNYDIHVGAIGGLAGKLLVFATTLIAASLPITGFLIWWGKRNRRGVEHLHCGKQKASLL
jgi:uncharacterized iron-regulated membrane protein